MTAEAEQKTRGWVDFKTIKAMASFEAVLDHCGLKLKRKGSELIGICPFHDDSKASLHVNEEKKAFHCFGCDAKGNIIDFVAKKEGVTLKQSAGLIAEWCNLDTGVGSTPREEGEKEKGKSKRKRIETDKPDKEAAEDSQNRGETASDEASTESAAAARRATNRPLGFSLTLDPSHPYLKQRGLSDDTISCFGLGYCDRGILQGRIAIPIHNEVGNLVAYTGRLIAEDGKTTTEQEKYRFPQNFHKSLVLFNLNRVPAEADCAVVVEGYFSVFWLYQCGFQNVVALMGTSMSQRQKELLCERFKRVMLFFDGDDAGRKASFAITNELAKHVWVRVIPYLADLQPDKVPPSDLKSLLT